jgi:trans-aconitate methyltransferase
LAPNLFAGLEFSGACKLLEIGCGVGAELKIISERWPGLVLTGLDHNRFSLRACE